MHKMRPFPFSVHPGGKGQYRSNLRVRFIFIFLSLLREHVMNFLVCIIISSYKAGWMTISFCRSFFFGFFSTKIVLPVNGSISV